MSTRAPAMSAEDRRAAIAAATLPLLLEHGANVSTSQIARAAGIAEGTIFRAFPDKDTVLRTAAELAFDPSPAEHALAEIDRTLPFEERLLEAVRIIQRRCTDIWKIVQAVGRLAEPELVSDFPALAAIFADAPGRVRCDPADAARRVRAVTLAVSHPLMYAGAPMPPEDIVSMFLHGMAPRSAEGSACCSTC